MSENEQKRPGAFREMKGGKMKFEIRYGLGGGFGGCGEWVKSDAQTEEEAKKEANELACEEYDGYAGHHGLRDIPQIMEEDGLDEEEAEQTYQEERDGWIDYEVRQIPE